MASVAVELPKPEADPTIAEGSALHTECPSYCVLVQQALAIQAGAGFGDIERLDAFRLTGPDNQGRPVFMFIPGNIPEDDAEATVERLTLYVLSLVHDVVIRKQQHFTAIWLCNNESDSRLTLGWFRRTYYSVPYAYHQQLSSLCLVHPSITVRCIAFALSYLLRVAFWDKLNFADRLEFLDSDVPVRIIKSVPQAYKDYDKHLDREMYSDAERLSSQGLSAGISGMSVGGLGPLSGASGIGGLGPTDGDEADGEPRPSKIELPKRNWEREDNDGD